MTFTDTWPTLLAKLSLVFSPVLVTYIIGYQISITYAVPMGGEAIGFPILYAWFIEAPMIAIVGGLFSRFTRKRPNAKLLSFYGYAAPAIAICVYLITHI